MTATFFNLTIADAHPRAWTDQAPAGDAAPGADTSVLRDPPSLAPAALLAARLLASPGQAAGIAERAVAGSAITPRTLAALARGTATSRR
jgi:hypothetical protein